jgi:hypothetical protein
MLAFRDLVFSFVAAFLLWRPAQRPSAAINGRQQLAQRPSTASAAASVFAYAEHCTSKCLADQ